MNGTVKNEIGKYKIPDITRSMYAMLYKDSLVIS